MIRTNLIGKNEIDVQSIMTLHKCILLLQRLPLPLPPPPPPL